MYKGLPVLLRSVMWLIFAVVLPSVAHSEGIASPASELILPATDCANLVTVPAQDPENGLQAEHAYILHQVGRYSFQGSSRGRCGKTPVDIITVADSSGRLRRFFFDIHAYPGMF